MLGLVFFYNLDHIAHDSLNLVNIDNIRTVDALKNILWQLLFQAFHSLQGDDPAVFHSDDNIVLQPFDVYDVRIVDLNQLFIRFDEDEIRLFSSFFFAAAGAMIGAGGATASPTT